MRGRIHENASGPSQCDTHNDNKRGWFLFFYKSSASTAHIGRSLPSPPLPSPGALVHPQHHSRNRVPSLLSGREGNEWKKPKTDLRPMGEAAFLVTRAGWGAKVRACDRVHAVLLHSNDLQWSSITSSISMTIIVYNKGFGWAHLCVCV